MRHISTVLSAEPTTAALIRADKTVSRGGTSRDGAVFYHAGPVSYVLDVPVLSAMLDEIGDAARPELSTTSAVGDVARAKALAGAPDSARLTRGQIPPAAVRDMAVHRLVARAAAGDADAAAYLSR